jgi:hypothetical protein
VSSDLYVFGGTVRVEGRVDGDLVAFGRQVDISGPVAGDVLVGAGTTTVSGQVDGDVRVGSGQVTVRGPVGEDVLVGAGRVTIAREARLGGDLIFSTGRMTMDGSVSGNALGSSGDYVKRGSIAGTEQVNVEEAEETRPSAASERVLDLLRRYLGILVVGALLLWLAPRALRAAADVARGRPLLALGVGLLGFVGVVALVLAVILATVLVAIVLGLLDLGALVVMTIFSGILTVAVITLGFVLAVAFGAQAAVGMAVGRLVLRAEPRSFFRGFGALALGVFVVVLLSAIPLVGGWLELLFILLGLGALVFVIAPRRRQALHSP